LFQQEDDDHNHWGVQAAVDSLQQIAIAWRQQFPQELILQINDVSLPYGGLFDVNGNWHRPHGTHRTGRDTDIRTELPGSRTGVPVRTPRNAANWQNTVLIRNGDFEQICDARGFFADIHLGNTEQEHYHLDFVR
jgi:hypothetical protein